MVTELPETFEFAVGQYADRCDICRGFGGKESQPCIGCRGLGYFGIDPVLATICPPGTEEVLVVKRVRLHAEIELRQPGDRTLVDVNLADREWTPLSDLRTGNGARRETENRTEREEVA